jgi:hypothetical protein
MTTGTPPMLQPLTIGQLLDRAVRLYRRRFLTFVGIVAIVLVPLSLAQLMFTVIAIPDMLAASEEYNALTTSGPATGAGVDFLEMARLWNTWMGGTRTLLFSAMNFVLVQVIAMAALARAVGDSYLGESIDILEAYGRIARDWPKLLLTLLLSAVLSIVMSIFTLIPCAGWLIGPGLLMYYGAVVAPLFAPILVLEGQSFAGTIRRAWDLVRRRFWWTVLFVLVLLIFNRLIIVAPTALISYFVGFGLSDMFLTDPVMATTIQTIYQSVFTLFLTLLYMPLQMTAMILMLFDLRVRTEGFDLTILATRLAGGELSSEALASQAPDPGSDSLVTGTEVVYFIGITAGVMGIFAVFYCVIFGLVMALVAMYPPVY